MTGEEARWAGLGPEDQDEPMLMTKCPSCGLEYSLHTATVCPKCFAWPEGDGVSAVWECWRCGDLTENPGTEPRHCRGCGQGSYQPKPRTWVEAVPETPPK